MKKVFLSTSIPYVNGDPHIGHALEFVQTDVIARWKRIEYGKENVFFLSGADENALKNVLAAEKEGKETGKYVSEKANEFKKLRETLNVSFDDFIHTTEDRHFRGAQKLWKNFRKEDIYEDEYEGLYCVGCEEFKSVKELVDGKCEEHDAIPERVKEKNYFFRLSNWEERIRELVESDQLRIVPEKRKNEVLGFLKEGLRDFSISRSRERAKDWGVPVPGDDTQVMYVWVDALSNYITGLDYAEDGEKYQEFWKESEERIHVIGKGIVKFHALYWIGMLLSAGLPLPSSEFVHGYVTVEKKKIGKSLGNAIHPNEVVDKYGIDAFRYYLLREIPAYSDGDFSWQRMEEVYQADLANGIGNLVARVAAMAMDYECTPVVDGQTISEKVVDYIREYRFDKAIENIWSRIKEADTYINKNEVWKLEGKEKDKAIEKLRKEILQIGVDLQVFLPETAEKILIKFTGPKIVKGESLFPRL